MVGSVPGLSVVYRHRGFALHPKEPTNQHFLHFTRARCEPSCAARSSESVLSRIKTFRQPSGSVFSTVWDRNTCCCWVRDLQPRISLLTAAATLMSPGGGEGKPSCARRYHWAILGQLAILQHANGHFNILSDILEKRLFFPASLVNLPSWVWFCFLFFLAPKNV